MGKDNRSKQPALRQDRDVLASNLLKEFDGRNSAEFLMLLDVMKGITINSSLSNKILSSLELFETFREYTYRHWMSIATLAGRGPLEKIDAARQKRTYDRMKSKGVCCDTICDLLLGLIQKQSLLAPISSCIWNGDDLRIPLEDWYDAFSLLVARYKPDAISDQKCTNFASILNGHEEELYAIIIASCNARVRAMDDLKGGRDDEAEREVKKELLSLREECERLSSENKTLRARLDGALESNSKLRVELSQVSDTEQKKALAMEAEHRQEVKELVKRLEDVEAENSVLLEDLAALKRDNEAGACEDTEDTFSDVELPETGVLFLGGHPNLIKKLRQIYPDWMYLGETNAFQARMGQSIRLCYIWSKHLPHSVWGTALQALPSEVPIIYLESTNLARLENEMRKGYHGVLEQINGASPML